MTLAIIFGAAYLALAAVTFRIAYTARRG